MADDLFQDEKLRIGAYAAPLLRDAANEGARKKRFKTVGPDGKVRRVVSRAQLLHAHLVREGIEIGIPKDGSRPRALLCECGMPWLVPLKGRIYKNLSRAGDGLVYLCVECRNDLRRCSAVIDGRQCARPLNRGAHCKSARRSDGHSPICNQCATEGRRKRFRALSAALTPEQRKAFWTPERQRAASKKAKKKAAALTPEQRREMVQRAQATQTTEWRRERMRKEMAALTPEQRSERANKAFTAMTPKQHMLRSERMRKANAALTPEQRSANARARMANLTPEQKAANVERGRRAMAALTPEQRREMARKANANQSHDQRSEATERAWDTRRKKKS
jgi:Spy/CpxP family protein refolding chaperone